MIRSRPLNHSLALLASALMLAPSSALANPLGAQVVGGQANIQGQNTSTVTVTQGSNNAIINWNTFNIGAHEVTQFIQPSASSIALNRVIGGLGPSQLDGMLTANGRIFLVNPNGILIGQGAVINVAGFLATTHDIANDDFMAGRYNFTIRGRPDASVVNLGTINATNGGFAALVAPGVRNAGVITANLGQIGLASGNGFTLDFYGDKLITLQVNDQIANQVIDVATGQPLKSLVSNEGRLKADGGQVALTAVAARIVVDSVVNNTGVIEANSVGTKNGMIVLGAATAATKGAGAPTQKVKISGTLSAKGGNTGEKGGTIQVTGEQIELASAKVDASGDAGGGTVLIGGDTGGGTVNPAVAGLPQAQLQPWTVPTASAVSIDATTVIDASAKSIGDGGKVVVWSDQSTSFAGSILATGGALGGNGGFAEVSSSGVLSYTGLTDLSAPNGQFGTLLLDPYDLLICNCDGDMTGTNSFVSSADSSNLNVGILVSALGSSDVIVATGAGDTGQPGNITVAAPIEWSTASTLTLKAANDIHINSLISGPNGGLILNANNNINPNADVNVRTFTLQNGYWSQLNGNLPAFSANDFRLVGGTFLRAQTGNGSPDRPYLIADIYGLQGIGSPSGQLLSKSFALANDIDASGTSKWNNGAGFMPIGSAGNPFTGTFDGRYYDEGYDGPAQTINHLTIAPVDPNINSIGLFGANAGTIQNVNLADVNVTANPNANGQVVGTLVGQNFGTISNVWVSGTINGGTSINVAIGGLAGQNGNFGQNGTFDQTQQTASITNSFASVDVTSHAIVQQNNGNCSPDCQWANVGGLVGQNLGTITDSIASGAVVVGSGGTGGGLVGRNNGSIQYAGALGDVTGDAGTANGNKDSFGNSTSLGGLVGQNQGSIDWAYAVGNVGTPDAAFLKLGGLVATNNGTISNSVAIGSVRAGNHSQAGGLVAENNPGGENCDSCGPPGLATITNSYAFGDVMVGSQSIAGGLVGVTKGTINDSAAGLGLGDGFDYGFDSVDRLDSLRNIFTPQGGTVRVGDNSIGGGFVAVNDLGGVINNSAAFVSVESTGANSAIGGFVGVNGGTIGQSQSSGSVNGTSNSYLGGFVGINIGAITDSTVTSDASVSASGSSNLIGGFVGVNLGLIDPSSTSAQVTDGTGNVVGRFAGANLDFASVNFPANLVPLLPGPSFPTGTISNDSTAPTSDVNDPFIGTPTVTSGFSTLPSIVNTCTDALCQIFQDLPLTTASLIQPPPPPTDNNSPLDTPPPVFQQIVPPNLFTNDNQLSLINLTTGGGGSGNGGSGNGGNGNGGGPNGNKSPGPPPGPGLGRTYDEQHFSGVPPIGETRFLPGEIVMQISDTISLADVQKIAQQFGITLISSQNIPGRVLYRFSFATDKDIRKLIVALEHINLVASVQPNYVFGFAQATPTPTAPQQQPPVPSDTTGSIPPPAEAAPDLANSGTASLESLPAGDAAQYVIDKLQLGAVHRLARGRNVTVAVIDSEIDVTHPDLRGVIAERYDATQSPSHPHVHGTGMAGAIASHSRLLGVAPGVRLLAIKAFDESASSAEATSYQILKGLDYAIVKNVRIINMSFAGPRDPMMERTLKTAHDKGIILIAAAGNAGPKSPPLYPGADPSVIAVTATDYADKPFAMANRGKYIAVAAPGVDVMVPAPGNTYQLTTGTSVAAAHVSGVAALLVERKPTITPDELRAILMHTARAFAALPKGEQDGAGLVDPVSALQALSAARSTEAAPQTRSATVH